MRQLEPMILKDRYWRAIQAEISRMLYALLYGPLAAALNMPPRELQNDASALRAAVAGGRVWYEDGLFKGDFNAPITRDLRAIGARFNIGSGTWSLARDMLPAEIRMAQATADSRYADLKRAFLVTLDDINIESISRYSQLESRYTKAIDWLEGDFQKTVAAILIPPKLTDDQRGIIARDWSRNLEKYIKDWTVENILELRQTVETNAFAGRRAADLVELFRHNYGVGRRKAEFLARQETALLMSKFQETRYASIGVRRYRWSGANDERERPDHKDLNNKIFSFDDPPVTDRRTGARNNPGEDYNCRCIAIPIIE